MARKATSSPTASKSSNVIKKTSTSKRSRGIPKSFTNAKPPTIIGRDEEKNQILTFLKTYASLPTTQGGSLYISGSPGTGKTALILELLAHFSFPSEPIYFNCMNLTSPSSIFQTIYYRLLKSKSIRKKTIQSTDFEAKLNQLKNPITIVLDEIDQLYSHHRSILSTLFQWSLKPNIAFIGIANSLDLIERLLLPSFPSSSTMSIQCVPFTSYSPTTLHQILQSHFPQLPSPVLHFIATKVAATSSDVRHALTLTKQAQRLAGADQVITLRHVAQALSTTPSHLTSSTSSSHGSSISLLPFSAQLALVSLILITTPTPLSSTHRTSINSSSSGAVDLTQWYDHYLALTHSLSMPSMSMTELRDLSFSLETTGLIQWRQESSQSRSIKTTTSTTSLSTRTSTSFTTSSSSSPRGSPFKPHRLSKVSLAVPKEELIRMLTTTTSCSSSSTTSSESHSNPSSVMGSRTAHEVLQQVLQSVV